MVNTPGVAVIIMAETQSYKELLAKWADKYRGVRCAKLVSVLFHADIHA